MKQTAVEWLLDNLLSEPWTEKHFEYNVECWDKALEMEKEQIVDFAYVIADDLACGVFRDKEAMEKRYDEFLTFRTEEDETDSI